MEPNNHPRAIPSEKNQNVTLPETPLKIGHPKRKRSYSNHPFLGAMLVSGRVGAKWRFIAEKSPIGLKTVKHKTSIRFICSANFFMQKFNMPKTTTPTTPWKINMEPQVMEVWMMIFLFNWVIFRFHVNF